MEQIIIGALITVIVGAAAALITARIEHRRWLRQERLEAWSRLIELASQLALRSMRFEQVALVRDQEKRSTIADALAEAFSAIPAVQGRAQLLGPKAFADAAEELMDTAFHAADVETLDSAERTRRHDDLQAKLEGFIVLARGRLRAH